MVALRELVLAAPLVPGLLAPCFAALALTGRLAALARRLAVAPGHPFTALWCYRSGEPLAQLVLPGQTGPDAANLAGIWRVFDGVLAKSLASPLGSLRSLRHGEYTFLFESGRYLTLAVLLRGSPPGGLRSDMRRAVRGFEAEHGDRLITLDAAVSLAEPALAVLDYVLSPRGP